MQTTHSKSLRCEFGRLDQSAGNERIVVEMRGGSAAHAQAVLLHRSEILRRLWLPQLGSRFAQRNNRNASPQRSNRLNGISTKLQN